MSNNPQTDLTVTAQTISLLVTGQPDIDNKFGPGCIRPDSVRLSYRGRHVDARVDGRWVREDGELTNSRLDQHYRVRDAEDIVGWPDWLCALATLLRPTAPAATPAVPVPPTTHATLSGRVARGIAEDASQLRMDLYDDLAAYARQTGNTGLQHAQIRDHLTEFLFESLLHRMAAEAQQQPDIERICICCGLPITGRGVTHFGRPEGPHYHVDREACRAAGGLPPKPVPGPGRVADEGQGETGCGPAPDQCDAESGEPCANHEREAAHAEGEHCFCGPECKAPR